MSEELRPLSAYTAADLVQHLLGRVSDGVFLVMVGDPSAAETFRAEKLSTRGMTTVNCFFRTTGAPDRERIERTHYFLAMAMRHEAEHFKSVYGVYPSCYGEPS